MRPPSRAHAHNTCVQARKYVRIRMRTHTRSYVRTYVRSHALRYVRSLRNRQCTNMFHLMSFHDLVFCDGVCELAACERTQHSLWAGIQPYVRTCSRAACNYVRSYGQRARACALTNSNLAHGICANTPPRSLVGMRARMALGQDSLQRRIMVKRNRHIRNYERHCILSLQLFQAPLWLEGLVGPICAATAPKHILPVLHAHLAAQALLCVVERARKRLRFPTKQQRDQRST